MNKMLWIVMALAAASLLGGCVAVHEEHRGPRHQHGGPPPRVIVVPAPHGEHGPPPQDRRPREWR